MKRLLLNLFTALSLLAFVLSAVGWVVGERRAWQFTYRRIDDEGRRTGDVSAWSWRGSLVVQAGKLERPHAGEAAVREPPPGPRHYDRWRGRPTMTPMDPDADRFGGFALTTYGYTFWPYPPTSPGPYAPTSVMNQVVMVPWYAILLMTAAVPLRSDREWLLVSNAGTVQLWHTRRLDVTSVSDDGTFTVEEVPIDAAGGVLTPGNGKTWRPIDLPAWGWPPVARCKAMTGGGFRNPDGRVGDFGIE
ncbi:MAG TPA: hypothetical protein VFB66_32225, partial [Tepidisphaeraceae bacterium]|nr:hypothetical protein [Tepidisphaeraceae bacterium]